LLKDRGAAGYLFAEVFGDFVASFVFEAITHIVRGGQHAPRFWPQAQ
jgi:hypothetical protein